MSAPTHFEVFRDTLACWKKIVTGLNLKRGKFFLQRFVKTLFYLNHSVTGVCKVANSILSSCWGGKSNVKEGRGEGQR